MKDIEPKIRELLNNRETIQSLLLLEKARKGVHKESLLFIGMANIAGYYWCAMQAVFKSKTNELGFFSAYLYDRIWYSHQLGFIDKLPNSRKALLDIGTEIAFDDVEKLLREKAERLQGVSVTFEATEFTDEYGECIMLINPDLPLEQRVGYEMEAKGKGIRIGDPEKFPKLRGKFLETERAERYPTIRWNFEWGKYVIVGVPDGITKKFVYEFKTTRNRFLMGFMKPVALTQADIYGYFFMRDKKRVQIHIVEEGTSETWESKVDGTKAEKVFKDFTRVDTGWVPPSPKTWKCKSCEFKPTCPISPPSSDNY